MALPTSPHTGPLSATVALLLDGAPASDAAPSAPGAHVDPAAFLSRLMDLRGSVELAGLLSAPPPRRTAVDPSRLAALRALADDRAAEARSALDRVFAEPYQRRNKLPMPEQMFAQLQEAGLVAAPANGASRAAKAIAAAVDALWIPFAELFASCFERARGEMMALRAEIAPALRALGPTVARVERLDATIHDAIAKRREPILATLTPALAASFARSGGAAIAELPALATVADVAAWFGALPAPKAPPGAAVAPSPSPSPPEPRPEGSIPAERSLLSLRPFTGARAMARWGSQPGAPWIRRELRRGHVAALAVLEHERSRIEALLRAAAEDAFVLSTSRAPGVRVAAPPVIQAPSDR